MRRINVPQAFQPLDRNGGTSTKIKRLRSPFGSKRSLYERSVILLVTQSVKRLKSPHIIFEPGNGRSPIVNCGLEIALEGNACTFDPKYGAPRPVAQIAESAISSQQLFDLLGNFYFGLPFSQFDFDFGLGNSFDRC